MKEIALLMVALVLLSSAALAQYGTGGTTGIGINTNTEVNLTTNGTNEQTNTDVDLDTEISLETDADSDYKDTLVNLNADVDSSVSRISQTYIANGFGWAVQENNGRFVRIMVAERVLAKEDGEDYTLAQGILQFDNSAAYKLTHDSREQGDDEYSVWMNGNYLGILDIDDKEEYGNLVVWRGNLKLEDQDNYKVEFAASDKWVKDDVDGSTIVDTELDQALMGKKTELRGWARLKSLFNEDSY